MSATDAPWLAEALDDIHDHVTTLADLLAADHPGGEGYAMEIARMIADLRVKLLTESRTTYRIIRFHRNEKNQVIRSGLTLAEAQAHCRREDTRGPDWFDGYEKDPER